MVMREPNLFFRGIVFGHEEKKVHRVRPDLTYEDDIHFKLAKLKLLKDLSEQIIDSVFLKFGLILTPEVNFI